ncbi:hypothetical protein [Mucilaginibacter myungsuensis]|uniref:Uncharacterized protein n=1 Tax=Mucilaginibacter myungsuensis TaxID=649104 RepID=A0A929PYT7_9SPHI|nr:hypothetical protein [Mucilaginibacter myungsuensis]MBE9664504.1 hypothetical protein [Mucilaginibacter myungsuensis]MDN3601351.1 hypothetical protein [Mucilaginibacter myungsuensis]
MDMRLKNYTGYILAATIALFWILGRVIEQSHLSKKVVTQLTEYDHWIILALIAIAIFGQLFKNRSSYSHSREW